MSNGCLSMLLRRMGFQGLLHERGLIDSAWLRQQLGLDGKAAARTTAKRTNMT